MKNQNISRRLFIKKSLTTGVATGIPLIVPFKLFSQNAPSNKITVGCIGVGRMGLGDMKEFLQLDEVQVVAVCDVDKIRCDNAKNIVDEYYRQKNNLNYSNSCETYEDYRELLDRQDIDAVMITTPDHWHALQGIDAAKAGKDLFVQKPLSYSIAEGRALVTKVHKYNRILQVGSQQRSDAKFRFACELVRNNRIGKINNIKIGYAPDISCGPQPVMNIPENLNYDFWQGPAPERPYTEFRVHPQVDYGRPGWMRVQDYCLGMVTGWGSHHMDIAHWGMGIHNSGPVTVWAEAVFPDDGLWNVHLGFRVDYEYENGIHISMADNSINDQGVRFEGENGWVYVRRGFIDTFPKSLLKEKFSTGEIRLYRSNDHKKNFIESIKSRRDTVAPVDEGHQSGSACILGHIAMISGRKLSWNPATEQFTDDDDANRFLYRPMRDPWAL